jgi:hypothetical protein
VSMKTNRRSNLDFLVGAGAEDLNQHVVRRAYTLYISAMAVTHA